MGSAATPRVKQLLERLAELPEENQDAYAAAFLQQMEADDDFDRLIASHPDVLRELADEALAEAGLGRTAPLLEADFDLEKD